jgi:hypothetical protein
MSESREILVAARSSLRQDSEAVWSHVDDSWKSVMDIRTTARTGAVILAAVMSSRMGETKRKLCLSR